MFGPGIHELIHEHREEESNENLHVDPPHMIVFFVRRHQELLAHLRWEAISASGDTSECRLIV